MESVRDCPVLIGVSYSTAIEITAVRLKKFLSLFVLLQKDRQILNASVTFRLVEQPQKLRSVAGRADLRRQFVSFETAVLYLLQRIAVGAETCDTTVYNRVLHSLHRGNIVGVVLLSPSVNSGRRSVGILVELPKKNYNGRFRALCVRFSVKTCPGIDDGLSKTDVTVSCPCCMNLSGEQCGDYHAVFRTRDILPSVLSILGHVFVNLYQRRRPKEACGHVYRVPLS